MLKPHRLVIIGVGHVGSYVLKGALESGLLSEIALIDLNAGVASGEALDAQHAIADLNSHYVNVHVGDYADCANADVIICAAGPSILPGDKLDRLQLLKRNIPVITQIMTDLTAYTQDTVLIFITNPLDLVTYHAIAHFDYHEQRIFGTGTTLESLRFHSILGSCLKVDPRMIQGFVLGEHGNSAFPAFSTVNVGGVPYADLQDVFGCAKPDEAAVAAKTVAVAYEVLNAKGWTNTGIAQGAIRLMRAVLCDEHIIAPVSARLHGEYGLENVALSLPSIIGRHGVEKRLQPKLTATEEELLLKSGRTLQQLLIANQLQ